MKRTGISIRLRLTIIYTAVLTVVFLLSGITVYSRSEAALLNEIDRSLSDIAAQVVEQTKAFPNSNTPQLQFPEDLDVFSSATVFMVAIDEQGAVRPLSDNLEGFTEMLDPAGRSNENRFTNVTLYDQRLRVLTAPLFIETEEGDRQIGHLQVARLLNSYDTTLNSLRLTLVFVGLAAVCISLLLGDTLTHSSLRPLYDIARAASRITRFDDLGRRVPDSRRNDEIGNLARAINRTLERLEDSYLIQQRFFADVSHELRTPLTTIRGNVDLIRRFGADDESLDAIQEELERMTRLLTDLMFLARADSGALPTARRPVDLDSIFFDVYRQVTRIDPPVRIRLGKFGPVRVLGDADRLRQLLQNLVNNAIKYTPVGGNVTLSLERRDDEAVLTIADTGIGIKADNLPHVFDRFYRVDESRERKKGGFGLGLSIARWITETHDGQIAVASEVGVGTTFTVRLPALPVVAPGELDDEETETEIETEADVTAGSEDETEVAETA